MLKVSHSCKAQLQKEISFHRSQNNVKWLYVSLSFLYKPISTCIHTVTTKILEKITVSAPCLLFNFFFNDKYHKKFFSYQSLIIRSKPRTFNNNGRIHDVKALVLSSLLKWQNSALATLLHQVFLKPLRSVQKVWSLSIINIRRATMMQIYFRHLHFHFITDSLSVTLLLLNKEQNFD